MIKYIWMKRKERIAKFDITKINEVFKLSQLKRFKKGEIIFGEKEIGKNFFIVNSGSVEIIIGNNTNKPKVLSVIEKGSFFGELALLGIKYRTASAICQTDCELYVISEKNFKKLLNNKKFLLALLYTLAKRIKKTDEEIEDLIFSNMFKRVIKHITRLSKDINSTTLKITQTQLAKSLGTSRVCVARILSYLKNKGLIETSKNHIILKNPKRLYLIGEN